MHTGAFSLLLQKVQRDLHMIFPPILLSYCILLFLPESRTISDITNFLPRFFMRRVSVLFITQQMATENRKRTNCNDECVV